MRATRRYPAPRLPATHFLTRAAAICLLLSAVAVSAVPASLSPKDPAAVEGLWSTGGSLVEISRTENTLQMIVVALEEPLDENGKPLVDGQNPDEALQAQPILGMDLLANYKHNGKRWAGKIYDPETGNTYSSRMQMKDDVLEMRGYIGTPLLGKTKKFKPISRCRADMLVMLKNSNISGYCGL